MSRWISHRQYTDFQLGEKVFQPLTGHADAFATINIHSRDNFA